MTWLFAPDLSTAGKRPDIFLRRFGLHRRDDAMAETKSGKKFVKVKSYSRKAGAKTVKVRAADRSTPRTSTGKKKWATLSARLTLTLRSRR
jgi:hypothetical protein